MICGRKLYLVSLQRRYALRARPTGDVVHLAIMVKGLDHRLLFPYRIGEERRPNVPCARLGRECRTPTPNGAPDRRPIKIGEVWENPFTGERSVILERPWNNPASRVTGELTALVGARVMGEHRHPAVVEQFTVLEGAFE